MSTPKKPTNNPNPTMSRSHQPLSTSEGGGVPDEGGEGAALSGRAVSARNATTHGLFARDVVLPTLGEDPAAFDALLVQLCTQLPARNILERHYLEQIAAASWRLRRLHRWQAQVYEDTAIDEDARMDKLDKTLRHETMLTRQIDRAVRLLHRDLPELFQDRAREDTLTQLGRTEGECRAIPGLAAQVERISRRAVQAIADQPPLADGIDPVQLDNIHVPPQYEKCENKPTLTPEPVSLVHPACEAPLPVVGRGEALAPGGGDTQKCENEPAELPTSSPLTPPLLGAGGHLDLPLREAPVQQGSKVSSGPDYLHRCFLTGQRHRTDAPKNAKTNLSRSHWPFSPSSGGKVPDEGG